MGKNNTEKADILVAECETPEVKEIKPEKVKVYANFVLIFFGKRYKKDECIEVFDGDAKRLIEKGYARKEK